MGYIGRIPALTVGNHTFKDVVTSFKSGEDYGPMVGEKDGNLGAEILRRFKVTFDYANERMLLEPGKSMDEPFEHDMSGLEVSRMEDGSFTIDRVVPGSAADEAGLIVGDSIVEIMGRAAGDVGLFEWTDLTKKDGEKVVLAVNHEGNAREVTLTLRRQI